MALTPDSGWGGVRRNETNVPKCRMLGNVRIIAFRVRSLVGLEGFLEQVGLWWTLKKCR